MHTWPIPRHVYLEHCDYCGDLESGVELPRHMASYSDRLDVLSMTRRPHSEVLLPNQVVHTGRLQVLWNQPKRAQRLRYYYTEGTH